MQLATETLATAEDLLAQPRDGMKRELLWGRIEGMSPTGFQHGAVTSTVCYWITKHVRENQLGQVCAAETGFLLSRAPDLVRAPDVAFIQTANLPGGDITGYAEIAPDLVVEVLSPNDRFVRVEEKARCWLQHGTTEVWVVDPENRRVLLYTQGNLIQDLAGSDTIKSDDVLPGFRLKVEDIFR